MENFKPHPKFNHLEKDFKPIITSISKGINLDEWETFPFKGIKRKSKDEVDNIDYKADRTVLDNNKILNGGLETYVISDLNSKDKFTTGLYDCTGLVIVGEDIETGKNVSILSHQDPKEFLSPELNESFKEHLVSSLDKITKRSKKGSIDVLIVGGNSMGTARKDNYISSVTFIGKIIKDKLNFDPTVITGPKDSSGATHVYFDNENRRLYLLMPGQRDNITYQDYKADKVEEQIKIIDDTHKYNF